MNEMAKTCENWLLKASMPGNQGRADRQKIAHLPP